jgi:hypothetical protein
MLQKIPIIVQQTIRQHDTWTSVALLTGITAKPYPPFILQSLLNSCYLNWLSRKGNRMEDYEDIT